MAVPLSLGPVHHLRLTVTDVERSRAFYTELLGFQIAMDTPPPADDPHHALAVDLLQDGIVMINGDLLLGLRPVDAERRQVGDGAVVHATLLEGLDRRLQLSSTGHGEAQVVKAAAEGVEAVAGPVGIHRTQPQEQVAVDHDDAVLQQVGG